METSRDRDHESGRVDRSRAGSGARRRARLNGPGWGYPLHSGRSTWARQRLAARDRNTTNRGARSAEAPVVKAGPTRPKGALTPREEMAPRDRTGGKAVYGHTYLDCFTAHFKVEAVRRCADQAR